MSLRLIARGCIAVITLLVPSFALAAQTNLDFENADVPLHIPLENQYASSGVILQGAVLDIDPAAHSGTRVLRATIDEPLNVFPLVVSFTSPQARVKLFAGSQFASLNGTLTAFDSGGNVVAADGPRLVPQNTFTTAFQVTVATASITRVEFQLEGTPFASIDDLEFEGELAQSVNVLTQHNDKARTGANLGETQLNVSTVGSGQFGKLFSVKVDGQIYAQPLYASKLKFADGSVHNVVYVATMHNSVYAIDADQPSVLWSKNLGPSVIYNFMPMVKAIASWKLSELRDNLLCKPGDPHQDVPHNIEPEIGITSTPVIDLNSNTIYVVAKTTEIDASCFTYRLHALDLLTGNERAGSPALITAQTAGNGAGSVNGTLSFDPKMHLQRPGLLLANGRVYIAFGAHQDTPPYHGWILAYDARTLTRTNVFTTTPNGEEGGIWQSGNGLAADESGNIYMMVGNGSFDTGPDFGDSFVKLSKDLTVLDWFTPYDFGDMDRYDIDLGSAGPLLLPGTSRLVGGGKGGVFYLVNENEMGHLQRVTGFPPLVIIPPPVQQFPATPGPDPVVNNCGFDYHHIHGSPVTWNSPKGRLVYVWGERDTLKAFRFDSAKGQFASTSPDYIAPDSQSKMKDPDSANFTEKFMPGAALSISANGSAAGTGILWASLPLRDDALAQLQPGILRAFDAADLSHALWCASVGTHAKFAPPTIANGKVYLGTFDNHLNVYGLGARTRRETTNLGGYHTQSAPFVSGDYVYFRGEHDKLYKVNINNPNGDNTNLGGYSTKSTPFVSGDYVYFRGEHDKLYKVNINNPNGDNTNLGGYSTKSTPFVSGDYVYFQGAASINDELYKVNINNPNGDHTNLGGYHTQSAPFVSGDYVYFRGEHDKLYKVNINNPNGDNTNLGGYSTKSTPFVSGDYVYFQGAASINDELYKVNINNPNGDNTNLGGLKTKSTPFVAGDSVYFQGPDDMLNRVSTDGTGTTSPHCGSWTKATPFVDGNSIFFQDKDDRLLMADVDE